MKPSERDLLARLRSNKVEDPVAAVRNSLGSVAHVVGNPMMKAEITLQITTEFNFDMGGGGAVLIPPAGLLPLLQTWVPIWLFGLTDFYGGYNKCRQIIPLTNPWNFGAFAIVLNNGIAGIALPIEPGDFLLTLNYFDPIPGDTYTAFIRIHCNNVAYGTFLNSFVSDLITIDRLRYIIPIANINQFINPLIFANQTLFGKTTTDNVDPRLYILPTEFQQQIADVPLNLPISKSVMLGFQLDVFCQQVNMILFVNKVEPLTHRKTKIIR